MIKIYILATFIFYSLSLSAQTCTSLGCSKNYGTQNATSQTVVNTTNLACITSTRQVFWQFFYSPTGGNYTQAFTPTGSHDLDWVVFSVGAAPPSVSCPVNTATWASVTCNFANTTGSTGPGTDGTVATTAGNYYAVAVTVFGSGNWAFSIGTPQLGGSNLTAVNCPGVLPIKLESFTAALQNNNVLLKWGVSEELNVSHYEIEFGTDGRNFKTIGTIAATNSTDYSFTHSNGSFAEIIYYRLKTVDKDGTIQYSNIIRIHIKSTGKLSVMPNPVADFLTISGMTNKGKFRIVDVVGKVLLEKNVQQQALSINVTFIKTGLYLLQYFDGEKTQTQKFLKQ